MRFELHGRAAVPPVLGVEVLGLGDVASERHEFRAELVAEVLPSGARHPPVARRGGA